MWRFLLNLSFSCKFTPIDQKTNRDSDNGTTDEQGSVLIGKSQEFRRKHLFHFVYFALAMFICKAILKHCVIIFMKRRWHGRHREGLIFFQLIMKILTSLSKNTIINKNEIFVMFGIQALSIIIKKKWNSEEENFKPTKKQ